MYEPEYQLIDISFKNKPNIITYNIQKFLWSCKTFNPIINLLQEHSIILLQECYDESFSKLKNCFPDYYICREKMQCINMMNSGLVILSKYPIYDKSFIRFTKYNRCSFDYLSEKGFLVTWININNRKVCIINTHLQSAKYDRFDNIVLLQIKELFDFIKNIKEPYIIGGDFNIDIEDMKKHIDISDYKLYYPKKSTIYINFTTGATQYESKLGYEGLIFDYFITKNINNNIHLSPITIDSSYSDHNPVSSSINLY
jgi:endonuclease/exonuclease/phosphatase family metal-dependent hydrolase